MTAADDTGLWAAITAVKDDLAETDRAAAERIAMVDKRTSTHEAVCAERYRAINFRLNILICCMTVMACAELFGWKAAILMLLKAPLP